MCGFVGYVSKRPKKDKDLVIRQMSEMIKPLVLSIRMLRPRP